MIIGAYRGATTLKPILGRFLTFLTTPLRAVGRFLFTFILVPTFHGILLARRGIRRLYLPAKNKLLFLFTNRYAIHGAIILVSIFSVSTNVRAGQIQTDALGGRSVLVTILGADSPDVVIEVAASNEPLLPPVFYRESVALESTVAPDLESILAFDELTASPTTTKPSSAKRTTIEEYVVAEGDTIGTIAEQFDLSITTILWSNNLSVRSIIRPGDTLTILPVDGITHTVKSGDTLSRIASTYGVTSAEIVDFNNLADANDLTIGESLLVPGGEKQAPTPSRSVASVRNLFTPEQTSASPSPLAGSANMIWPTDLSKINTYYGQYYVYGRHYGLDIDCNYNNNNYAAADGIVTFSGWNRGGYGYFVQIDHGNGLVTAYGHHAKLYVSKGDSVTQGQPIGLCGTTGRSTGTHLHFEVRVNGQAVNPLNYVSYKK